LLRDLSVGGPSLAPEAEDAAAAAVFQRHAAVASKNKYIVRKRKLQHRIEYSKRNDW
jgi:hypothetical protein